MRLPAFILAASLLLGCSESTQDARSAVDAAVQAAQTTVEQASVDAAANAAPAVAATVAVREVLEAIAPEPLPPAAQAIDPAVVALVVRWEVGSPAQYVRKYQGVICPGGASGPTIGIGDDLGHQTAAEIRRRWGWHPDVGRMATASGVTGPAACRSWRNAHLDIRVSYADAIRVFTMHAWPKYSAMAARAYRNGWTGLTPAHQNALKSNGYNRGFSFLGSRRAELVVIRDQCVPVSNAPCTATQLRASCRVWDNQPEIRKGLCARRHAEADFAIL